MLIGLYKKYSHIFWYLVFGVATTAVNWITYMILVNICNININISNTIAWFAAVIFAYITNKLFVFKSKTKTLKEIVKEVILFFSSRIFSGIIEIAGVPFLMWCGLNQTLFGTEGMLAKIAIAFIVIVLNYIASKIIVFKEKKNV